MELTKKVEHYEILDNIEYSQERYVRKSVMQSQGIVCDFVCFEPGQRARFHRHIGQDEIFYVVEGNGVITFQDRDDIPVKPGSVVFTPAGGIHGVETNDNDRLVLMLIKGPGITTETAINFMRDA